MVHLFHLHRRSLFQFLILICFPRFSFHLLPDEQNHYDYDLDNDYGDDEFDANPMTIEITKMLLMMMMMEHLLPDE